MIDYFALALTHGLLLVGLLRLLAHEQLDHEDVATQAETDEADSAGSPVHGGSKPGGRGRRGRNDPRGKQD